MYKTAFGLRVRGVGKSEIAAKTVGGQYSSISLAEFVYHGGQCPGLGGAYITLSGLNIFSENMTAGRGFSLCSHFGWRWKSIESSSYLPFYLLIWMP